MKILLVEDSHEAAKFTMEILERGGHRVSWADTLDIARAMLEIGAAVDTPFELAILDNYLQGSNANGPKGTELIPDLTALGIPCCIFSGLPPRESEVGVPCFSKSDPFELRKWVEEQKGEKS